MPRALPGHLPLAIAGAILQQATLPPEIRQPTRPQAVQVPAAAWGLVLGDLADPAGQGAAVEIFSR